MEWHEQDGLRWLTYEIFGECPEFTAATFSRHVGVSEAPFDTLNVGDGLGDDEAHVEENIHLIQKALNIPKIVRGGQVHKDHIATITPASPSIIPATDGLVIGEPNLGAMSKHADCQVAIFYDPIKKVAATIHCGWRGSVQNIYAIAINRLEQEFRSRPENLLCAISPSLGPQVSEFVNYKTELPEPFWDHQVKPNHFDFWEISYEQLIEAGLLPDHIEIARVCTHAEGGDFFSFRRDGKTGRNGTVAHLR